MVGVDWCCCVGGSTLSCFLFSLAGGCLVDVLVVQVPQRSDREDCGAEDEEETSDGGVKGSRRVGGDHEGVPPQRETHEEREAETLLSLRRPVDLGGSDDLQGGCPLAQLLRQHVGRRCGRCRAGRSGRSRRRSPPSCDHRLIGDRVTTRPRPLIGAALIAAALVLAGCAGSSDSPSRYLL